VSAQRPFVSVIVATYERPGLLARCLERLSQADYPADRFEIVVVDDGGRMDVSGICAAGSVTPAVRLERQPNRGAAAARNRGAATARGELLLFTDDDCLVTRGWIHAMVDALSIFPGALVGGHTVNALTANPYAGASQLLVNHVCMPPEGRRQAAFANGNNLATSRATFDAVGGFDETFRTSAGEDRELSSRARQLGYPVCFAHKAVVEHVNPLTWDSFLRQHVNFGRAAFRLRAGPSPRVTPPPFGSPAYYLGLLAIPVETDPSKGRWWGVPAVRALLAVAQAANAAGFAAEWMRPRLRPSTPPAGAAPSRQTPRWQPGTRRGPQSP
jgi:GT2 family glycosyltransferase